MRVLKNDYIVDWEENKSQEIKVSHITCAFVSSTTVPSKTLHFMQELTNKGILPAMADKERLCVCLHVAIYITSSETHTVKCARRDKSGEDVDFKTQMDMIPLLMGQAAGAIDSVLPVCMPPDRTLTFR
jgi:hypothetical protein